MTGDDRYRYRRLNEGEVIKEGDEVLTDSDLGWRPAGITVGQRAPNPNYTSHRVYRRLREERPMQYLLIREVWDPQDEGPERGRYVLAMGEFEQLRELADADWHKLFPHGGGGRLDFIPNGMFEGEGLGEWTASLGDGSPATWTILEVRNGAGSQIPVSPVPGLAGGDHPEAGVLPQGGVDSGRPEVRSELDPQARAAIASALQEGASPPPWADGLAVPVGSNDSRVLLNGRPSPHAIRVLTEENYQLARACVNAVFERGKLSKAVDLAPPFRFNEKVRRGQIRSYKGRLYQAKQDIKAETNSPPYSAFWQTVRRP